MTTMIMHKTCEGLFKTTIQPSRKHDYNNYTQTLPAVYHILIENQNQQSTQNNSLGIGFEYFDFVNDKWQTAE